MHFQNLYILQHILLKLFIVANKNKNESNTAGYNYTGGCAFVVGKIITITIVYRLEYLQKDLQQ